VRGCEVFLLIVAGWSSEVEACPPADLLDAQPPRRRQLERLPVAGSSTAFERAARSLIFSGAGLLLEPPIRHPMRRKVPATRGAPGRTTSGAAPYAIVCQQLGCCG